MTNRQTETSHSCQKIKYVTLVGMLINIFLTVIKIIAGYIGNSQSVIADGIHSLSDTSTDIAVLVGLKYWSQPPDCCHPYGHRRIETMVTVFIGLLLIVAGIILGKEAVDKIHIGEHVVPTTITLVVAIASVIIKELLYRWTMKVGKSLRSLAVQANAWHHRTDSFSSIAVSIAIGMAMIDSKWAILDPIATLIVSGFILQVAFKIILPALRELADSGANNEALKKIEEIILTVEGIESVHALRSRFQGYGLQVDLHIQVKGSLSVIEGHEIAGKAKRLLIEKGPDIIDVLVHVEPDKK